jgi:penicillin-binding protein 1A
VLDQFIKKVVLPIVQNGKKQFNLFYLLHKSKLTGAYWQQKLNELKHSTWRKEEFFKLSFILKTAKGFAYFLFVFSISLFILVYLGALGPVPSKAALKDLQNNSASEVYSADGVLLGRYFIQDRTNISYDEISPYAVKALIATEDVRFYEHSGIDYQSLARVFVKTLLLQDESSGGGSTLSQQLAKNLYPRRRYWLMSTPINKLREMIIALRLEDVYSKEEIIELYLNTVPLGGDLYGIERASQRFFNVPASKLKLQQAAVLIGMLKANTTYNPKRHPERSKERRNVVLNQMAKYGYLEKDKAEKAKQLPLKLNYSTKRAIGGSAPYFTEHLKAELEEWCEQNKKADGTPYNLYTNGLKITTTLDATMQGHAEKAVRTRMSRLQKVFNDHWKGRSPWENEVEGLDKIMRRSLKYKRLKEAGKSEEEIKKIFHNPVPMNLFSWNGTVRKTMSPLDSLRYYELFLNTGLVSIEPRSGHVKAWVGGINHRIFKYDHVRSRRQVGSTFKPIVYASALEKGIEPCAPFSNERLSYPEYENWSPRNANGEYGGVFTMRAALAHSVNTISAQLLMQTGIDETINLAHRLGIRSHLPEVPALALGAADLSLLEMVTAYTTFINEGSYIDPVFILKITDRKGTVLHEHEPEEEMAALSQDHAAMMLQLMQGVVEEGSARRLRNEFGLQMDIAGKTGTTQNHSDGWFIGITPELVTGVWVGAESPLVRFRTLKLGQGANTALPIWGDFMLHLTRDRKFRNYRYSRFATLDPAVQSRLECDDSSNEGLLEEEIDNFFDRLFDIFSPKRDKDETDIRKAKKTNEKNRYESKDLHNDREQEAKKREKRWKKEEKRREKLREHEEKMREKQRELEDKRRERQREIEEKIREENLEDLYYEEVYIEEED